MSYELPRARRLMLRLTMRASMAAAAVRRVAIVLVAVRVIGAIDPANTLVVIAAACGCGRRSAVRGVGGRDDARVDVRRRLVLCRAVVSGLHETCDLGAAVVEASIGAYSASVTRGALDVPESFAPEALLRLNLDDLRNGSPTIALLAQPPLTPPTGP